MIMRPADIFFSKRFVFVALLAATMFIVFAIPSITFAQADSAGQVAEAAGLAQVELTDIIGTIIRIFLGTLGIIFLVIVIYAGFLWLNSGGDPEKIGKAKKWLVNGVIGLVIMLFAYAITTFVINALTGGVGDSDFGTNGDVTVVPFSGSLGAGALQSHYPARGATDIARNTMISVTFRDPMFIESFINGYDTAGTADDVSDDDDSGVIGLNTDNVKIYVTADGEEAALASEEVAVAFTEDLETFVFYPPVLGSSTEDTNYTVRLSDSILDADGGEVLSLGGYIWTFSVGTEIDLEPPTVSSIIPRADGEYGRNIVVEVTFDEAIDPTSSTGSTASGFSNIQVVGESGGLVEGTYTISNEYRTITFISSQACGTNSCGYTIFCLPGSDTIQTTVFAATPDSENLPQSTGFPYDGIVDTSGNVLDGDGDWGDEFGEVGDDYLWSFLTTNDIILDGPVVDTITPDINAENVDLDQPIIITFDGTIISSTINSENITLNSQVFETGETPAHELYYFFSSEQIEDPFTFTDYTQTEIEHGVFLESDDTTTYEYRVGIGEGVQNEYQNCFDPAEGPGLTGATCGTSESEPWCCDGVPSATACIPF